MSWPRVLVKEIAEVKGGTRLPKGHQILDEPTDHPYIRVVDFERDGFKPENIKYISDQTFDKISRYTIAPDDIYVSIAGTIGRVGMVPETFYGANLTENAAKITNIDKSVVPKFLLMHLRSYEGQAQIIGRAGGTSQPKLALYRIADIDFPCPPVESQNCIAAILSTYDQGCSTLITARCN